MKPSQPSFALALLLFAAACQAETAIPSERGRRLSPQRRHLLQPGAILRWLSRQEILLAAKCLCSIACIAILAAARPASPWEPTHGQPGIGERASLRILQPDYQGSDTSAEQYLFESIALPSVYVVHGFPDRQTPQPFGDFTSAQDMADIIAHLMTFR